MKHCYIKTKKAVRATLLALTTLLALPAAAQTDIKDEPGSPYLRAYQYYTISDGTNSVPETKPYLERVTDQAAIKGLIGSLIADTQIPGQLKVKDKSGNLVSARYIIENRHNGGAHESRPKKTDSSVTRTDVFFCGSYNSNSLWSDAGSWFYDCYRHWTPAFNGLEVKTDVLKHQVNTTTWDVSYFECVPEKEGKTVLLVETVDNLSTKESKGYNEIFAQNDYEGKEPWIKAVTVLPLDHQMDIIADGGSAKTGTLVNIKGDLNKFFVAIKGSINPHVYLKSSSSVKTVTFAPFEYYFEQLAPININNDGTEIEDQPLDNAYDLMYTQGKKFPVNHDCSSVFRNFHPIMMGSSNNTDKIYSVNMLLYIPDDRNVGGDNGNVQNWRYNMDKRPYFFIQKITLESALDNTPTKDAPTAWVKQNWTSTLQDIIPNQTETFYIQRSYDGVTWTTVPQDEIDLNDNVTWTEDGLMKRVNEKATEIKVRETMKREDQTVHYRVYGRILCEGNKDFEFVLSNEDDVVIKGWATPTNPDLLISVEHVSEFIKDKQVNNYTNTINFLTRGSAESELIKALRPEHVGTDGKATTFYLRRFENVNYASDSDDPFSCENESPQAKTLVTIVYDSKDENGNYTFKVYETASGQQMDDLVLYAADDDSELTLKGHNKAGESWFTYVDKIEYNVLNHRAADNTKYNYILIGKNVKNVLDRESGEAMTDEEIRSNLWGKTMPAMKNEVGLNTYTLEQIQADVDASKNLSATTPRHSVTPLLTPRTGLTAVVETVNVPKDQDNVVELATLTQGESATWRLTSNILEYNQETENWDVKNQTATGIRYDQPIEVLADSKFVNEPWVMTIHDGNNTYGTPRVEVPTLPQVVTGVNIKPVGSSNTTYEVGCAMTVKYTPKDKKERFLSHGFGVWRWHGNPNGVYIPENASTINVLRHHKYDGIQEGFDFAYAAETMESVNAAKSAMAKAGATAPVVEGLKLTDDNIKASSKETINSDKAATTGNPFTVWYRVRYYAQYHPNGTDDANKEANPRYVILENMNGSRHDGSQTTGVEDINGESEFSVRGGFGEAVLDGNCNVVIVNLQGMVMFNNAIDGEVSVSLPAGLYIANGKKFIVR